MQTIKTVDHPASLMLPATVTITMTGSCDTDPFSLFLPTIRDRATQSVEGKQMQEKTWNNLVSDLNHLGLGEAIGLIWQLMIICRTGSFFSARGKNYVVSVLVNREHSEAAITLARQIGEIIGR